MDINSLANDEFLVECDVRNLHGTAVESYRLLKQQLEAELTTPVLVPNRAHQAARKNPRREIAKCLSKLRSLKDCMQELENSPVPEDFTKLWSKLIHIEGRIKRISHSKAIKASIPEVQSIVSCLREALTKWGNDEFQEADESELNRTLAALHINGLSDVNTDSDSDTLPEYNISTKNVKPSFTSYPAPSSQVLDSKLNPLPSTSHYQQVPEPLRSKEPITQPANTTVESKKIQQLAATIQERMDKLGTPFENTVFTPVGIPTTNVTTSSFVEPPLNFPTSNLCSGHAHLNIPENRSSANPNANAWSQIPISNFRDFSGPNSSSRNLYRWNLRFDGSSIDKTEIERFLYRVERTALKYQVSQVSLVEELGTLLTGEALEWYWLFLERHGVVTWAQLRSELVRRFQRHLTEEDIWQELDNRKQRLPKETFYDFYSAMLKIAMRSPSLIPEDILFRYIKKNMRPGLQFHLQMSEKSVKSVDQLIAICVHWEQTWNRNNYCPEAFLQMPKKSVHELDHISYPFESEVTESVPNLAAFKQVQYDQSDTRIPNKTVTFKNSLVNSHSGPDTRQTLENTAPHKLVICWNCRDLGHTYPDCPIQPTHIFCYGCGGDNVIKPRCVNCNPNLAGNSRTEMRWLGRTHFPKSEDRRSTSPSSSTPTERETITILKR